MISKQTATLGEAESLQTFSPARAFNPAPIPEYLQKTYWWAYLHPKAVYIFERQWLVNLILWGNFARLRDAALQEVGEVIEGKVLQVACVYGDFTEHLARRLGANGSLDVIDVAPIQIKNLRAKLKNPRHVTTLLQDSTDLHFDNASRERNEARWVSSKKRPTISFNNSRSPSTRLSTMPGSNAKPGVLAVLSR